LVSVTNLPHIVNINHTLAEVKHHFIQCSILYVSIVFDYRSQ